MKIESIRKRSLCKCPMLWGGEENDGIDLEKHNCFSASVQL